MNQQESAQQFVEALQLARKMNLTGVDMAVIILKDLDPVVVKDTACLLKVKLFQERNVYKPWLKRVFFEYEPFEGVDIKITLQSKPVSELVLQKLQYLN